MSINAIPNNMEKYMILMLGKNLTFIDSFQFMHFWLDKLVNNLQKEDLKFTSQEFLGEKLDLMSTKGVYPYDFMEFYSILNNEHTRRKLQSC